MRFGTRGSEPTSTRAGDPSDRLNAILPERPATDRNDALDLQFYRAALADLVCEFRFECKAYATWSCIQVLVGVLLVTVATGFADKLSATLLSAGGSLLASVTVFPLATVLSTRRKVKILDRYRQALQSGRPPSEAVAKVKEFVERQLA